LLAAYIDSTYLKPESSRYDIISLCEQAAAYGMAAVCINPCHVLLAQNILAESNVKVCTVSGFPLGAECTATKVFATRQALLDGANEVDMVVNLGAIKDHDWKYVRDEIEQVLVLEKDYLFELKVIVETALLSPEELAAVTELVSLSGADYIKTSTGFSHRGVNMEDIQIINNHRSKDLKIKASGGIKDVDFALQLINAGVNRIGTSNAELLLKEYMTNKR